MTIKHKLARFGALSVGSSLLWTSSAFAQLDPPVPPDTPTDLEPIVTNVINVLLFVVGAAAVIMLIVGGIRYIVSAGNQESVTKAKNTIMYSIIGVVIAILAYAIVNFVVTRITGS